MSLCHRVTQHDRSCHIRGFSKRSVLQFQCGTGICDHFLLELHMCISACMRHDWVNYLSWSHKLACEHCLFYCGLKYKEPAKLESPSSFLLIYFLKAVRKEDNVPELFRNAKRDVICLCGKKYKVATVSEVMYLSSVLTAIACATLNLWRTSFGRKTFCCAHLV